MLGYIGGEFYNVME